METAKRICKRLIKRAAIIGSLLFLLAAFFRIRSGISPPWQSSDDELQRLQTFYPDRYDDALESSEAFRYSAFVLPSRILTGYYAVAIVLIGAAWYLHDYRKDSLDLVHRFYSLRWLRTHFLESPLFSLRHHVPIPIFRLQRFTIQAPLRYQAMVIGLLLCINVVPLLCLYRILPGTRDVFWPDPHSHRDQLMRYLSDRSATLAMGQLPLVILMSGKNSPIALISGLEMNDLMLYHRWLARMVWLQMNVHSFGYVMIALLKSHLLRNFGKAYWNWGVVAMAMMWGLTVLSIREIRRRHYEVFVFLHIVMCMIALVALYLHIHLLRHHKLDIYTRITLASAAFWAFDRILRLLNRVYQSLRSVRGGICRASISALTKEIVRLRITMPKSRIVLPTECHLITSASVPARISAGQSIGLSIPDIQWVGDHPFTVMATGEIPEHSDTGYLDLAIKANQGLTKKLADILHVSLGGENHDVQTTEHGLGVLVEGPYGSLHEEVYATENLLLFAGGVGVTFVLPHFVKTALHAPKTACKLVWMIRDLDACVIIQDELEMLAQELQSHSLAAAHATPSRAPLLIEIHVTGRRARKRALSSVDLEAQPLLRASTDHAVITSAGHTPISEDEEQKYEVESADAKTPILVSSSWLDITIKHGRASSVIERHFPASELSSSQSLTIMSCGPAALCDEVRMHTKATSLACSWKSVHYIEECFSW
ncbi:hypothetical protein NliqN6_0043 [Naganishia liquefaciens]|uniref:FAD-binding FR-type domain-containing protein n=1 Tax=Naganishia liquefaciens TaxID=104408 RepID=A0A8H3TM64_9TREE|nr:hypothetical protein NliqN6_0043 [Naganishia liquefaciens]